MKKYVALIAALVAFAVLVENGEAIAGKVIRSKTYSYSASSSVSGVRGDVPIIGDDTGGGSCNGVSAEACDVSQGVSRTRTRTRKVKAPRMRLRASYEGCDMSQTGVSGGTKQVYSPPAAVAPPNEGVAAPEPPK